MEDFVKNAGLALNTIGYHVVAAVVAIATAIDWAFTEYLLVSNIISAGLLLGLGDFLVQTMDNVLESHRRWRYDYSRNRRTMVVGFGLGVFNHIWYAILDGQLEGNTLSTVLKKIALDQAIAGPFFCTAFFIGMGILEGKGPYGIYDELSEKFIEVYKADWMFWPAAQFINFYLIPHRFRVFYVNFATLLWNTFLTYMKHRDHKPHKRYRYGARSPYSRKSTGSRSSYHRTRRLSRSRSGSRRPSHRFRPGDRNRSQCAVQEPSCHDVELARKGSRKRQHDENNGDGSMNSACSIKQKISLGLPKVENRIKVKTRGHIHSCYLPWGIRSKPSRSAGSKKTQTSFGEDVSSQADDSAGINAVLTCLHEITEELKFLNYTVNQILALSGRGSFAKRKKFRKGVGESPKDETTGEKKKKKKKGAKLKQKNEITNTGSGVSRSSSSSSNDSMVSIINAAKPAKTRKKKGRLAVSEAK